MEKELARELLKAGAIKFGDFTLKSGVWSPYYINLRILTCYPNLLVKVGEAIGNLIKEKFDNVDKIIGVAYAGIPLVTAVAITSGIPACYTRKEMKEHGIQQPIEGEIKEGESIVIVDDLVTSGQSMFESIEKIKSTGMNLNIKGIAVLFDREQGGKQQLAEHGITLHSIMSITEAAKWLRDDGILPEDKYNTIVEYVKNPPKPK